MAVQAKAKGATVWQHRNRAKATHWKSVEVQVAEAVGAQQPPGKTTIESLLRWKCWKLLS
jgi:hypothetical protein